MTSARALAAITAGALFLRLAGVGFGPYHPDEHLVINHSLAFGTGDLNPHMFYFPAFFMYLLFAVYGFFYIAGHWIGRFPAPDSFLSLYLVSPQVFYVLGRIVSALFGAATVPLAYHLGKEYKNARTGLAAMLFLAVNFLHVRDSHFATMDVALTFFMTLSLCFLMRGLKGGTGGAYRWAAFTAGAAAAVKYNGFILAVPIAACLVIRFSGDRQKGRAAAVRALLLDGVRSGFLMLLGFFLFSPYTLIDCRSALGFIGKLYELNRAFHVSGGAHARNLYFALGEPLFVLSVLGLLMSFRTSLPAGQAGEASEKSFTVRHLEARRAERSHHDEISQSSAKEHGGLLRNDRLSSTGLEMTRSIVVAIYFMSYYAMITRAGQPFERYVLPLVPVCIVWASAFLDEMEIRWAGRFTRGRFFGILCGILVLAALPKTLFSDYLFLRKDTRDLGREWIERHVDAGSVVVIDDPGQSPKLAVAPAQIREKLVLLKTGDPLADVRRRRLERMLSLEPYPSPSYNLYYLAEEKPKSAFVFLGPLVPYEMEALESKGMNYLIAPSEARLIHPDFYRALEMRADRVASFDPRRDASVPPGSGWTYLPVDGSLWNYKRPGPWLTVYKIRAEEAVG